MCSIQLTGKVAEKSKMTKKIIIYLEKVIRKLNKMHWGSKWKKIYKKLEVKN